MILFFLFYVVLNYECVFLFLFICFQIVAITVGVLSVAVGIGIPVFYETQIDNAVKCFYYFFVIIIITISNSY
jgi:hypothetical protein